MNLQIVTSKAKLQRLYGTLKVISAAISAYTIQRWDALFAVGVYASSRHIPGVRFAGIPHPGIIGTAPSTELLATWNKREKELRDAHAEVSPPVAHLPLASSTYIGQDLENTLMKKIANEGARTLPGRENGGNCDVSMHGLYHYAFGT